MTEEEALLQQSFQGLQAEVRALADSAGDSAVPVRTQDAYAEIVMRIMSEMGLLCARPELCRYEGTYGNARLRISAAAVSDDADRLDLLVSLYEDRSSVFEIPTEQTKRAAGQCLQFLRRCADGSLARRIAADDEASSLVALIESSWKGIDQVKIWVLTNGLARSTRFRSQEIDGRLVSLEVVDLRRFMRMAFEGEKGEGVNVDFARECGEPLPCVFYSDARADYDTALCLLPGEVLRSLYERYDARLLEANVRSFLSMQSKVNRGIYATLRGAPQNFLAYNNGIVAVADSMEIARTASGTAGIRALAGMRIVNGGQTTATLFFGRRRDPRMDLSMIRVPAKILVLKTSDADAVDAFVTDIARFANTQNNVRASDLSSSSPLHVGLEHFSRTTWCNDGQTQWFYERTTGSYRTMLAKEKTPAARRRLRACIPPSNRITKLDLAKYMNIWFGEPSNACLSPQKSYAMFMRKLQERGGVEKAMQLSSGVWKDIVSIAILYRAAYRGARQAFPGSAAVLAAYSVAVAARLYGGKLRLRTIWENQAVSRQLLACVMRWQNEINGVLRLSSLGKPLAEWGKDPECWKFVQESVETPADLSVPEADMNPPAAPQQQEFPGSEPEAELDWGADDASAAPTEETSLR